MAELPPELGPVQAPVTQPGQPQDFRSSIAPLAEGDPASMLMAELMAIADDHGLLDDSMSPGGFTPEDQADLAEPGNSDPLQFLDKDEIERLTHLFMQVPPQQQQEIVQTFASQMPPEAARRMKAAIRMVVGKAQQEQATG